MFSCIVTNKYKNKKRTIEESQKDMVQCFSYEINNFNYNDYLVYICC